MKWYYVALITLLAAGAIAYFFWPGAASVAKTDVKYNPQTGAAIDPASVTTNPVTGAKY